MSFICRFKCQLYLTHRALSGAPIPGQSQPGNDDNRWVLHIPQSVSITGASPSDCLVSYSGHSFGESHPLVKIQCVVYHPS